MHFLYAFMHANMVNKHNKRFAVWQETSVGTSQQNVAPTSKPYSAGVIIIVHVATDQVAWTASDRS